VVKIGSDKGQAHGRWKIKAYFWCDVCEVTTLHLSDGPAEGYDGSDWVWRWFCQKCGDIEARVAGPWPFDHEAPEAWEGGDVLPWDAEFPEALEWAKQAVTRDILYGFLLDRVLPATYVVGCFRAAGMHEHLVSAAKKGLGIASERWRGRWWWVPPWIPWHRLRVGDEVWDTWGVGPSLQDPSGVALDEDGLPC